SELIVIRKEGTRPEGVDVAEHEAAHVLDPITAEVAPKVRVIQDMTVRLIAVAPARERVVKDAADAGHPQVSPIDTFLTIVVLRHYLGIPAKVLCERVQPTDGLLSGGRMRRRVVIAHLESLGLELLHPRSIFWFRARASVVRRLARSADRPHALRG